VNRDLSNLLLRSLSGAVFVILVIGSILAGPWALGAVFFFFAMVGLREAYLMLSKQPGVLPRYTGGYLIGAGLYALWYASANQTADPLWWWLLVPPVVLMWGTDLFYLEKFSLTHFGATAGGWLYVVLPFGMIHNLAFVGGSYNYGLLIGYFALLWSNDTFAYLSGKWLGKHKLYEKVSPGKTIEGTLGGFVCCMAAAWLISLCSDTLTTAQWMLAGAIVSLFATLGDLIESHIKRSVGVKDSGTLIPGHGGVLDRFDGMIASLPMLIFYLKFVLHL
jgi:phosphatidate cytidylyltransferase